MVNFYMNKLQESIQNTFKDILSGNVSPRSIQTNLKENISNLAQQTENINMNETVDITGSISEKTETVGFSKWNFFKIILAIFIIGLLAINAYTYVTNGTDAFTYFLGNETKNTKIEKNNSSDIEKNMKETQSKKSNEFGNDKATTAIHSSIDIEAEKLSQNEKNNSSDIEKVIKNKKTNKKAYKANNVSNNVNKKVGYCYVGSDRNVRTCVKIGENDTCMSGEVFPTRDICINPNLKE